MAEADGAGTCARPPSLDAARRMHGMARSCTELVAARCQLLNNGCNASNSSKVYAQVLGAQAAQALGDALAVHRSEHNLCASLWDGDVAAGAVELPRTLRANGNVEGGAS